MNDLEKAKAKEHVFHLLQAMKEYNAAVETHNSEIKKIEDQRGVWDPDYIKEKKNNLPGLGPIKSKQMEKVSKLTEDFINFYEGVLSKPLDVEDPKLANAISLIQTGVLDWDNAKKLNENFKGDRFH